MPREAQPHAHSLRSGYSILGSQPGGGVVSPEPVLL
jgi:hypothetical protein